ncbi:MAG: dihydrofolate reductase family protein [Microcella sp.]|mgnify:CR=1 FL=1
MLEQSPSPIVYYVAQSLDGFIADEANGIDWLLEFGFEAFQQHYDAFYAGVGSVIMGARTFRWLVDSGEPWPYPELPCWVLSRSGVPDYPGANARVTRDDVAAVAREARNASGGRSVWMLGGGVTAARFAEAGELDELRISVMPVSLGRGAGVLPHLGGPQRWALTGTTTFDGGAIELAYRAVRD